jgi:Mrp family chromosome partitioning ATPase
MSNEYSMTRGVRRAQKITAHSAPSMFVAKYELDGTTDPRLVVLSYPTSEGAAAFRVLALQVETAGDVQVIAVSSARPHIGKTICAVNLALALSESKRARVLLVEASVRNPMIADMFGTTTPSCFARQLEQHRESPDEPWSVIEVSPLGLHLAVPDARAESRPLIDGPAFAFAMSRLRDAGYQYIVVESPAVLGTAEVNLIAASSDGVLLTAYRGRSRTRDLKAAINQLGSERILGTVLIDG